MNWKRKLVVIVLVLSAIFISFVGARFPQPEPETISLETQRDDQALSTTEPQQIFDEEGRIVLMVGETELRIPASENATSTVASPPENRMVRVTLCWPEDHTTGKCPGIENIAVIFLQGGKKRELKIEDGMAKLKQELSPRVGSPESTIPGVWTFPFVDSDKVFYYALIEPDSTGRHVIARCYTGPRCHAWARVAPGLSAHYNFDKKNLAHWPQLDQRIREYVRSFISEE